MKMKFSPLKCSFCQSRFTSIHPPFQLPCSHLYCLPCLSRDIDFHCELDDISFQYPLKLATISDILYSLWEEEEESDDKKEVEGRLKEEKGKRGEGGKEIIKKKEGIGKSLEEDEGRRKGGANRKEGGEKIRKEEEGWGRKEEGGVRKKDEKNDRLRIICNIHEKEEVKYKTQKGKLLCVICLLEMEDLADQVGIGKDGSGRIKKQGRKQEEEGGKTKEKEKIFKYGTEEITKEIEVLEKGLEDSLAINRFLLNMTVKMKNSAKASSKELEILFKEAVYFLKQPFSNSQRKPHMNNIRFFLSSYLFLLVLFISVLPLFLLPSSFTPPQIISPAQLNAPLYDFNADKKFAIFDDISKIFQRAPNKSFLYEMFLPNRITSLNLLYRASEHSFSASAFHKHCDEKGPTIVLIESKKKRFFGGYTPLDWTSIKGFSGAEGESSFLFSLDKKTKHTVKERWRGKYIYGGENNGPTWGEEERFDLHICDGCHERRNSSSFLGGIYKTGLIDADAVTEAEWLAGERKFFVNDPSSSHHNSAYFPSLSSSLPPTSSSNPPPNTSSCSSCSLLFSSLLPPLLLPCSHLICLPCLRKSTKNRSFICPIDSILYSNILSHLQISIVNSVISTQASFTPFCCVHQEESRFICDVHHCLLCSDCLMEHLDHKRNTKLYEKKEILEDLEQLEVNLQAKYQKNSEILDKLKRTKKGSMKEEEVGRKMEEGKEFLGKGWIKQLKREVGGLIGNVPKEEEKGGKKGKKSENWSGIRFISFLVVVLAYVYKFSDLLSTSSSPSASISSPYSFSSFILPSSPNPDFLLSMFEPQKIKSFSLLFRASSHNFSAAAFHKHCDDKGPTLLLIKAESGRVFGGWNSVGWFKKIANYSAPSSFLFSLDHRTKHNLINPADRNAISNDPLTGPSFGDLVISDKCNRKNIPRSSSYSIIGGRYEFGGSKEEAYRYLSGSFLYFIVKEYEVFKVEFE